MRGEHRARKLFYIFYFHFLTFYTLHTSSCSEWRYSSSLVLVENDYRENLKWFWECRKNNWKQKENCSLCNILSMRFLIWNFYATILKTHCICNDKMHQRCSTVESLPSSDENASIELFQFSVCRSAAAAEVTQDSQFSHFCFQSSWKRGCCRRMSSSSSLIHTFSTLHALKPEKHEN